MEGTLSAARSPWCLWRRWPPGSKGCIARPGKNDSVSQTWPFRRQRCWRRSESAMVSELENRSRPIDPGTGAATRHVAKAVALIALQLTIISGRARGLNGSRRSRRRAPGAAPHVSCPLPRIRDTAAVVLWREPNFARLWTAHTVSAVGSQVSVLALPLIAILTLHATAWEVGILRAASGLPVLLLGLLVGVWVDRMRRRPWLWGPNLVSIVQIALARSSRQAIVAPLCVARIRSWCWRTARS